MSKNYVSVPGNIVLLVVIAAVWSEHCRVKAEVYPSIYWTPHNPIFSNSGNELNVFLNSRIHIVCPNPATVMTTLKDQTSKDDLYENVWIVDETSFKTCSVRSTFKPAFLLCDHPSKLHFITIVFNTFQPGSSGNVFRPEGEYFFIATSDGTRNSLNSTSGGHCSTHNMKFKVYICKDKHDARCNPSAQYSQYSTQKTKTPADEDSIVFPSTSASLGESNRTDVLPNFCNNSAFGTNKGDVDHFQKRKVSVWPIAIVTSLAVLSLVLNAVLLWKRIKKHQNIQRDPTQFSINLPSRRCPAHVHGINV